MKNKFLAVCIQMFLLGNISTSGDFVHKALIEPFSVLDKIGVAFFVTSAIFFAGKEN